MDSKNKYIEFMTALQALIKMADTKPKTINKLLWVAWGFILTFGGAAIISAIANLIKVLK